MNSIRPLVRMIRGVGVRMLLMGCVCQPQSWIRQQDEQGDSFRVLSVLFWEDLLWKIIRDSFELVSKLVSHLVSLSYRLGQENPNILGCLCPVICAPHCSEAKAHSQIVTCRIRDTVPRGQPITLTYQSRKKLLWGCGDAMTGTEGI